MSTLNRSTMTIDRTMEFFSEKELSMQIGVDRRLWMLAILKELIDNSLDACESKGILPEISIEVSDDFLLVRDNGMGIPDETIDKSLDYLIRVSDKNLYVSPSRGQLGNALKCVYAAAFVLSGRDHGIVEIETNGKRHRIEVTIDRIGQSPKISHAVIDADFVKNGTSIKIFNQAKKNLACCENDDFYFLGYRDIIRNYRIFNSHLSISGLERTSGTITKWLPSAPTCSHWYSAEKLRDLIAGYLTIEKSGGNAKTVWDFLSEFRGLSSSRKRKDIVESLSMQRAYLHDIVVNGDVSIEFVEKILVAMNQRSTVVKPSDLGEIGKDHFVRSMPNISPCSFNYKKTDGIIDGLPYSIEIGFGILEPDFQGCGSTIIVGLNWSPCLSIPISELNEILADCELNSYDPIVFVLHIACPRFDFVDRGKGNVRLKKQMISDLQNAVRIVTKDFTRAKRQADREGRLRYRQLEELRKADKRSLLSTKAAAYKVMEQAYLKASGNGTMPANARQIMYAARPLVQELTGKTKPWSNTAYLTQTLLPDFIDSHPDITEKWDVVYDSRGKLTEPHTGRRVDLGTLAVRKYIANWIYGAGSDADISPNLSYDIHTSGPKNRYDFALFIEKEGFDELLKAARIAERFDIGIMSTKGMSVTAARNLVESLSEQGVTILVLHDLDKAGFSICHTLKTSGRRYKFKTEPKVIDLGLRLSDAVKMNLESELVEYPSAKDPKISLIESGATEEEAGFLRSGGQPKQWTGSRIELNAMTSPQFIQYLERKLSDAGVQKVIPNSNTLSQAWRRAYKLSYLEKVLKEAETLFDDGAITIPEDLQQMVSNKIFNTSIPWDHAIYSMCQKQHTNGSLS